jgi:hypothetical protein
MTERPLRFRQQDLTRALRAARAAGLEVSGYEIDPVSGKITISTGTAAVAQEDAFEKWKVRHADEA